MIIFDLDGTLANCEHRLHFVDPKKDLNLRTIEYRDGSFDVHNLDSPKLYKWKPDWKAFYEACDKDEPIEHVRYISEALHDSMEAEMKIWTGRYESVREKTEKWLTKHMRFDRFTELKMRPNGDSTPDYVLKEKWLDEAIAEGKKIDMVFEDRPRVIRMWKRRRIFVFNCAQSDEEF